MYINKAMVFGNLTRDPEIRALPSGIQVASFSIATNRNFKDRDGNRKEQVEFHNIVLFGKQAELAAQYLRKGASAYVEGRMQTRSWDAEGGKKYRTEIVAENIQFGPRTAGGAGGAGASAGASAAPASKSTKKGDDTPEAAPDAVEYPAEEINPEDIPF